MMEAVLEVEAQCPLLVTPARDGSVSFRVLDRRKMAGGGSQDLLEVVGPGPAVDSLFRELERGRKAHVADRIRLGKDRSAALVTVPQCRATCDAIGENAFLISQETIRGGAYRWRLLLADSENLDAVLGKLHRTGCAVRLIRVRKLRPWEILSSRQEEIVRAAWQIGYFDFPRKVSLTELASRLRLSKSALAQVLRRGEKKIVARHFEGYASGH